MQQISKRLTSFIWYGPPLLLSSSFAGKNRINVLRVINAAGAGYASWQQGRPVNSLTTIQTGAVVTLDALGIVASDASTFFNIDNGDAPAAKYLNPDVYDLVADAADSLTLDAFESLVFFNRVRANVDVAGITPPGSGTLVFSIEASIAGGPWLSLGSGIDAKVWNDAIAALPDADVAAGYAVDFRIIRNEQVGVYYTLSFSY